MQIASLIISPAFLTAGWYVMLGRVIQYLGPQFGSLTNRTYLIVFVGGDVASLVIQAIGAFLVAHKESAGLFCGHRALTKGFPRTVRLQAAARRPVQTPAKTPRTARASWWRVSSCRWSS